MCATTSTTWPKLGRRAARRIALTPRPHHQHRQTPKYPQFSPLPGGGELVTVHDTSGTIYRYFSVGFGSSNVLMPEQIEDRNGNLINATYNHPSAQYTASFTDTSGRPSLAISGTGRSGTTDTITAGPIPITVDWTSTTASYSMPITAVGSHGSIGCPTDTPSTAYAVNSTLNVVSAIHLPNGQQYKFYTGSSNPTDSTVSNPYGLLNEIIYPDGGWVKYTYKESDTYSELGLFAGTEPEGLGVQLVPNACAYQYSTPVVASKMVSYDGTIIALRQDFTYSTIFPQNGLNWTSKSTSVTTSASGKSFLTQYSYSPGAIAQSPYTSSTTAAELPLEHQIMTYDWGSTTSPLQTVTKTWADQFNMTEQDTMSGGVTSKITYTPGSYLPTETDEYDFGAATATRKTLVTYQQITAPGTIVNEPCKTVVTDGVNTFETDSYYDGGNTLCAADTGGGATVSLSPLPAGHDEANYGQATSSVARGNLTKQVRVLAGGTGPTTTFTYDETGQVSSITDPCGNTACSDMPPTGMAGATHTTTYSYTDSPAGANDPYGQSNAYVTTITRPSTNGVGHTESYQYNYASGQISQSRDDNSKPTTYSYADPLLRLKDVYGPPSSQNSSAQPHTNYNYSDNIYIPGQGSTLVNNSTVTMTGPSGIATVSVMDGLGNTIQSQLTSDPGNTDYSDTSYDGLGRVQSVSNPYRAGATYGITSFSYDALGRKTFQCQPDNSSAAATLCTPQNSYLSWSYLGNTVTFTDENGNRWQRIVDALGRLKQVQEPSGRSAAPTLTTTYTYNALDDLVGVNQQGTGSDVARNRSFTYDSLSRLLCASNPESSIASCPTTATSSYTTGTTGYSYDANGNLSSKTDARGIVTKYTYDALDRVLSKTYALLSGGSGETPSSCFQYDTAPNGKGRLGSEWTQSGSCPQAPSSGFFTLRTIYGYDELGRITNEQQCTPANCVAASGPDLGYVYDLAGKLTETTNSVGKGTSELDISNTFDLGGHLSSVTSSWSTFPTCLYVLGTSSSNCTPATTPYGYGPVGPVSWAEGPNLTVTQGYTNRLWVNSISVQGEQPNPPLHGIVF